MKKTKHKWWYYIKAIIRDYPVHLQELKAVRSPAMTTAYGKSEGHGYEVPRTTEQLAMRMLPDEAQKELDAVEAAIDHTKQSYRDADLRLKLIKLVYFTKSHTLQGAAMECHVSYGTAKLWQEAFIIQVAREFGLIK